MAQWSLTYVMRRDLSWTERKTVSC